MRNAARVRGLLVCVPTKSLSLKAGVGRPGPPEHHTKKIFLTYFEKGCPPEEVTRSVESAWNDGLRQMSAETGFD